MKKELLILDAEYSLNNVRALSLSDLSAFFIIHYHLNNSRISKMMIMIKEKIKKSFFDISSPPFGGSTQAISNSKIIIPNKCF